jgi:hypothetical protein
VKRVLADIDSGDGDCSVEFLRHNALLVFGATCQRNLLAGLEQGRTIPLPVSSGLKMRCCTTQHSLWYSRVLSEILIGEVGDSSPQTKQRCGQFLGNPFDVFGQLNSTGRGWLRSWLI